MGFNWDGCIRDKSQADSINLLGGGNRMLNAALLTKGGETQCKYRSAHVNKQIKYYKTFTFLIRLAGKYIVFT